MVRGNLSVSPANNRDRVAQSPQKWDAEGFRALRRRIVASDAPGACEEQMLLAPAPKKQLQMLLLPKLNEGSCGCESRKQQQDDLTLIQQQEQQQQQKEQEQHRLQQQCSQLVQPVVHQRDPPQEDQHYRDTQLQKRKQQIGNQNQQLQVVQNRQQAPILNEEEQHRRLLCQEEQEKRHLTDYSARTTGSSEAVPCCVSTLPLPTTAVEVAEATGSTAAVANVGVLRKASTRKRRVKNKGAQQRKIKLAAAVAENSLSSPSRNAAEAELTDTEATEPRPETTAAANAPYCGAKHDEMLQQDAPVQVKPRKRYKGKAAPAVKRSTQQQQLQRIQQKEQLMQQPNFWHSPAKQQKRRLQELQQELQRQRHQQTSSLPIPQANVQSPTECLPMHAQPDSAAGSADLWVMPAALLAASQEGQHLQKQPQQLQQQPQGPPQQLQPQPPPQQQHRWQVRLDHCPMAHTAGGYDIQRHRTQQNKHGVEETLSMVPAAQPQQTKLHQQKEQLMSLDGFVHPAVVHQEKRQQETTSSFFEAGHQAQELQHVLSEQLDHQPLQRSPKRLERQPMERRLLCMRRCYSYPELPFVYTQEELENATMIICRQQQQRSPSTQQLPQRSPWQHQQMLQQQQQQPQPVEFGSINAQDETCRLVYTLPALSNPSRKACARYRCDTHKSPTVLTARKEVYEALVPTMSFIRGKAEHALLQQDVERQVPFTVAAAAAHEPAAVHMPGDPAALATVPVAAAPINASVFPEFTALPFSRAPDAAAKPDISSPAAAMPSAAKSAFAAPAAAAFAKENKPSPKRLPMRSQPVTSNLECRRRVAPKTGICTEELKTQQQRSTTNSSSSSSISTGSNNSSSFWCSVRLADDFVPFQQKPNKKRKQKITSKGRPNAAAGAAGAAGEAKGSPAAAADSATTPAAAATTVTLTKAKAAKSVNQQRLQQKLAEQPQLVGQQNSQKRSQSYEKQALYQANCQQRQQLNVPFDLHKREQQQEEEHQKQQHYCQQEKQQHPQQQQQQHKHTKDKSQQQEYVQHAQQSDGPITEQQQCALEELQQRQKKLRCSEAHINQHQGEVLAYPDAPHAAAAAEQQAKLRAQRCRKQLQKQKQRQQKKEQQQRQEQLGEQDQQPEQNQLLQSQDVQHPQQLHRLQQLQSQQQMQLQHLQKQLRLQQEQQKEQQMLLLQQQQQLLQQPASAPDLCFNLPKPSGWMLQQRPSSQQQQQMQEQLQQGQAQNSARLEDDALQVHLTPPLLPDSQYAQQYLLLQQQLQQRQLQQQQKVLAQSHQRLEMLSHALHQLQSSQPQEEMQHEAITVATKVAGQLTKPLNPGLSMVALDAAPAEAAKTGTKQQLLEV